MEKIKDEMVTRSLDVNLTHEEVDAYSKTLAIEIDNRNALEAEAKSTAKRYKESIDDKKDEINLLAGKIRSEREQRQVPCKWTFDFDANTKKLIRQDTFDLVETRVIDPSERQAYLQLTEQQEIENVSQSQESEE